MELKAHFTNIHQVIIELVEGAQFEIAAAIAWFTDRDIFEVLCKKAQSGVKVSLAVIGDEINLGPGGLNFQRLSDFGCLVAFLPHGGRNEPMMHHKFCVIDRRTVITGSYNWSRKARSNDENITVVTDSAEFAKKYQDTFASLVARADQPATADADATRRRLEMIRHLILLGEQDHVGTHVRKLRPVAAPLNLSTILEALDRGEFALALEQIDAYLRQTTAIVVADLLDVGPLRFWLETLELRLESLSEEKTDIERRLQTFNRRHDEALGDLLQKVLRARAELAQHLAASEGDEDARKRAKAEAKAAEEAFKNYSKHHEELQAAKPLPKLDEASEGELKKLYRKACSLCHPDKFPEGKKAAAHRLFVELQNAYKSNDLPRIRAIYQTLAAGGIPGTRSITLSELDDLKAAIAELEYKIRRVVSELYDLQASEGVKLAQAAGATEVEWQQYFEQQREVLESVLASVVLNLQSFSTK